MYRKISNKIFCKDMNKLIVNDKIFEVNGKSISVDKNKIYVDGDLITKVDKDEVIIKFEGDLANLQAEEVVVNGNIIGDIDCVSIKVLGDINGDIDSNNTVINGDIMGNIESHVIKINGVNKGNIKII